METITKEYNIYTFDELSKDAKEKAISGQIDFEIAVYDPDEYDLIQDSVKKAESLQTPWFLASIIYDDHKDDIIENIKINNYGFFSDGKLIPLDYYPDNWD